MTPPDILPLLGQQPAQPPAPTEQDYGPFNEKLPQQLVEALTATVRKFQTEEMYLRRREILRDWKHRLYYRGYQHLRETGGKDGGWAAVTPGGVYPGAGGGSVQAPPRVDDYNIFQPFTRSLVAIHSQNPPGVDFIARDKDSAEDVESAKAAERLRHHYDHTNDVNQQQQRVAYLMALSGRTVAWTRTEADADRWGRNDDGSPKSEEVTDLYGAIESKVSLFIEKQHQANYLFLMDDPDIRTAKDKYPEFASQIKSSTGVLGQGAYERIARLGVLMNSRGYTQVGEAMNHLVPRLQGFIRTRAFTGEEYDNPLDDGSMGEDGPMTVGDKLKALFPTGCFITILGDVYVGSRDCCIDDEIDIAFPLPGDGMGRAAIMEPVVIFQDRFNDGMNAASEEFEYCWPAIWVDCETEELDAITSQRSGPGMFRAKKLKSGQKMEDVIMKESDPQVSQSFMTWLEKLSGELPQFILAIQPALFGAEMSDQKTAHGYAQAQSSALSMQSPTWGAIQSLYAGIYKKAAILASQNPDHGEEIIVSGDGGGIVKLESLRKGKFGCFPDKDSSLPETTAMQRSVMRAFLELVITSPMGAAILAEPANWEDICNKFGVPELKFVQIEARQAARVKIDKLLQGAPIPPSLEEIEGATKQHADATMQAHQAGAEPPPPFDQQSATMALMQPSVPVDPWIYPQFEAAELQSWLNSEAARAAKSNPDTAQGFANVVLYWQKVQQMAAQQMIAAQAMQPPPTAPAKPAGPPKPQAKPSGPEPQAAPTPQIG